MIIKPLSSEISIGTANTVANGTLVRVTNPTAGHVVVTVTLANAAVVGTLTVLSNTEVLVEKTSLGKVQGTGLLGTSVAYRS